MERAYSLLAAVIGVNAAVLASLFLAHFVGDLPWAHIDIAGVAMNTTSRTWHPEGCSGFGTRLLIELVTHFDSGRLHPGRPVR